MSFSYRKLARKQLKRELLQALKATELRSAEDGDDAEATAIAISEKAVDQKVKQLADLIKSEKTPS